MTARPLRRTGLAIAALGLTTALLTPACSDDADTDDPPASTDAPVTDGTTGDTDAGADPTAGLPSSDSLAALADALTAAGQPCTLEYEGLEDADSLVSICVLPSGQATLRIWDDPALVADFVASGAATELTVYGANWTIDLRDAGVAAEVAAALDGRVGG